MKLTITGLAEIRARLDQVRPAEIMSAALAEQAERLAQAVRDGLAEPQGATNHDKPWLRTGALRDSIAVTTNGLEAGVGSNDPAAAPQEMGTSRIPPRPFLAPAAASAAEQIAQAVGNALAAELNGQHAASEQEAQTAPAAGDPSAPISEQRIIPSPAKTTITATPLAASKGLRCDGFGAGCQSSGTWAGSAGWSFGNRNLCRSCAVRSLGLQEAPAGEQTDLLRHYEIK